MPPSAPRTATAPDSSTSSLRSRRRTATERDPHRELALAVRRAGQKEVGHIGARQQEDEGDRAEEESERRAPARRHRFGRRHDHGGPTGIRFGVRLSESRRDQLQLRLRVRGRDPGRQSADDLKATLRPGAELRGVEGERVPQGDRGLVREAEALGHHTDDLVRLSIKRQRAPNDLGVAAEPAGPEVVTQYHDPIPTGGLLLRQERTPERRGDAEQ